jgi:F420-dependent oxidoreductase-like protein
MELGIHLKFFDLPEGPASTAATLARAGQAAEAAGISWMSVMDHYFQLEQSAPAAAPMLEGYTTLGYLAAHTTTVQLGMLVTGVTYRHPGLLAKIVASLDVLSEGRAVLGIGAAWYEREHRGLGVPFPPLAERFERLEETLQICRQMWDPDDVGPYEGRHYRLAETLCQPAPLARPRPPVLIGGSGERKTLRLVARYGDACNLFADDAAEVARKLDVLRRHCDDVGRDPAAVRTTLVDRSDAPAAGEVDAFLASMRGYAGLGVDQVMVIPGRGQPPDRWIDEVGRELVPRLADL